MNVIKQITELVDKLQNKEVELSAEETTETPVEESVEVTEEVALEEEVMEEEEVIEEEVEADSHEEEEEEEEMDYKAMYEDLLIKYDELVAQWEAHQKEMEEAGVDMEEEEEEMEVPAEEEVMMSAETVEPMTHSPEATIEKDFNLYSQNRAKNTLDSVMSRIANLK